MTVTVRGDGLLFNDGTLQTTASTGAVGATTNSRGISYSATTIPANGEGVITTFTLANNSTFGVGGTDQTWKNMTGARALDVNYYNTSKRGMMVAVTTGKTSGWAQIFVYVNGEIASQQGGDQQGGYGGSNVNAVGIIPAGASYSVSTTAGLSHWAELS